MSDEILVITDRHFMTYSIVYYYPARWRSYSVDSYREGGESDSLEDDWFYQLSREGPGWQKGWQVLPLERSIETRFRSAGNAWLSFEHDFQGISL